MRCVAIVAAAALIGLVVPARAELIVNISKSQQRLAVVVDGTETHRWPVSTGRRGYQTPSGSYRPTRLERHWYSRRFDLTPMPWSVFFYRGYAVHGTMEAYNLGRAVSHGCVRLRPDNASILFSLVRKQGFKNTRVVVTDGPLPVTPAPAPMADASDRPVRDIAPEHHAKARDDDARPRQANARPEAKARHEAKAQPDVISRHDRTETIHARLREQASSARDDREARLRAIYRKYGFQW